MIPDAAVDAAARGIWQYHETSAASNSAEPTDEDRAIARAALAAAAPHIRAQALRDAVAAFPLETITAPDNAVVWLTRRAEQIESA